MNHPLRPGDRVRHAIDGHTGTVKAIGGQVAHVLWDTAPSTTERVADLLAIRSSSE